MKILVKYPSRERPDKFREVISKYSNTANGPLMFLVSIDSTDPYKDIYPDGSKYKIKEEDTAYIHVGNSKNKIEAINADINDFEYNWDILILAADDMIPQVQGWNEIIINEMKENYPDTDGVLYHYDGYQKLNTMPIMGRKYYERFKYIYNPEYISLWCDNEFQEVAEKLGKQTYFPEILFRHETYFNDRQFNHTNDSLMKKNQSFFAVDKQTYVKRKALNFGL